MKLDHATIVGIVKRKGVSWAGACIMGMVLCAMDDELRNLVKRYVGLLTGGGGGALVLSVIWSILNDGKKGETIATLEKASVENLYKAPDGMMLVSAEAKQGEVVQK